MIVFITPKVNRSLTLVCKQMTNFPPLLFVSVQLKSVFLLEWCFIISIEVSSDHFQLMCTGFSGSHQRDSDYFDLHIYLSIKSNQVNMNVSKCGIAKASNGNISRPIQLIIDVVSYKMPLCNVYLCNCKGNHLIMIFFQKVDKHKRPAFKGRCLVGMFSAHPMRLHN